MADKAQLEAATPVAPSNPNPETDDHGHGHHHTRSWHPHTRNVHGDPLPGRPFDSVRMTLAGPAEDVAAFAYSRFVGRPRIMPLLIVLVWLTLMAMWGGYIAPFTPITIVLPSPAPAQTHRTTAPSATPSPDPYPGLLEKLDGLDSRLGGIEQTIGGVQSQVSGIDGDVKDLKARPAPPPPKKGLFEKK